LADKGRSQNFTEELFCFAKLLLRQENTNEALQVHQRLRTITPALFARDGQRFAMH